MGDLFVDLQQPILQRTRLLVLGVAIVFQRNPRPFGQTTDRFGKRKTLVFLDPAENVPSLVTAEAMKNLEVRIDVEARRFLFVKWAQRPEVRPGALQWQA